VERRLASQPDALLYRYLVDGDPAGLAPTRRVD